MQTDRRPEFKKITGQFAYAFFPPLCLLGVLMEKVQLVPTKWILVLILTIGETLVISNPGTTTWEMNTKLAWTRLQGSYHSLA